MKTRLLAAIFTLLTPLVFAANDDHTAHMASATSATFPVAYTSSTEAFVQSNSKMHKDMNANYTGDADVDFLTGMIPHHQGAIDMAKIVLKYGKDPEVRMFANDIIKGQSKEIRWMQDWLELHGPNPAMATPSAANAPTESIETQIKAAQQKVEEIEKRLEAKPTMPMLEDTTPAISPTMPISATEMNKAATIAEDMVKQDTKKLMQTSEEPAAAISPTIKSLSDKLDEAVAPAPAEMLIETPEEDPNAFRQPGM